MAEIKSVEDLIGLIEENKTFKFKIKVIAGSKTDSIEFQEEFIKVKVKQRAVEGKANKAIVEYLSKVLNLPKSKIEIINGFTSAIKTVEAKGKA